MTIVGVVSNALTSGLLDDANRPMMYLATADSDQPSVVVRVAPGADPIPSLRTLVAQADPRLPSATVTNIESVMQRSIARPRFTMTLLVTFTGLALVLAAVGLYGVTAYSVARRTNEIGVRMALGADRTRVVDLVLRTAFARVAIGVAVLLATALAACLIPVRRAVAVDPLTSIRAD